jgi:hypothetical protein
LVSTGLAVPSGKSPDAQARSLCCRTRFFRHAFTAAAKTVKCSGLMQQLNPIKPLLVRSCGIERRH